MRDFGTGYDPFGTLRDFGTLKYDSDNLNLYY